MSNETTHETHEPTGARLTDDDTRAQALAEAIFAPNQAVADVEWAEYQRGCVAWCEDHTAEFYELREQNDALLADRARQDERIAALEAANAQLLKQLNDALFMANAYHHERNAAEAENTTMRPLVEAVAISDLYVLRSGDYKGETALVPANAPFMREHARALVATWQTPAAPETTELMDEHTNGENDCG